MTGCLLILLLTGIGFALIAAGTAFIPLMVAFIVLDAVWAEFRSRREG